MFNGVGTVPMIYNIIYISSKYRTFNGVGTVPYVERCQNCTVCLMVSELYHMLNGVGTVTYVLMV